MHYSIEFIQTIRTIQTIQTIRTIRTIQTYGKRTNAPNEFGLHEGARPRPQAAEPWPAPLSASVRRSERPRRVPGCGRTPPASTHGMRSS